MRIAVLTSGILPVPALLGGAVENLVDYYLEYNDRQGVHDITVYSVKPPHKQDYDSNHTHYHFIDMQAWWERVHRAIFIRTHKGGYYNPYIEYFLYRCLSHIRKSHYDLIILENRPGYALALSRVTDAKLVVHLHNDFLNAEVKQAREICNLCSRVITVSDYIKRRVQTVGADVSVQTVYNGIDLQRFYSAKATDRSVVGFTDRDFVVVYSGRVNKEKGIKELIMAMKRLGQYPQIKLLVLGGSFFGNETAVDPFMLSLQEEAKDLAGRIRFTGFVSYDQVPSYLKMADVAVIPSMWEDPFPTTVLEAMAIGLPIIATNSGGISEACGECAMILNKNNVVHEISDSLFDLYLNKEKCGQMSSLGVQISKRYDKIRYAAEFWESVN